MKTYVFVLHNSTTGHYFPPIIFDTKEMALNSFVSEIQSENSELFNIKDSLSIYVTGRFDHQTGRLHPYLFKKLLIKGSEILPKPSLAPSTTNA